MNSAHQDEHPPAHLKIHDRHANDGPPAGHVVDCPRRGWTPLVECLACLELNELSFDPETLSSYVECTPKKD